MGSKDDPAINGCDPGTHTSIIRRKIMFYCDECRIKNEWPTSVVKSNGPCEICGFYNTCHDRPSRSLPNKSATLSKPVGEVMSAGDLWQELKPMAIGAYKMRDVKLTIVPPNSPSHPKDMYWPHWSRQRKCSSLCVTFGMKIGVLWLLIFGE